MACSLAWDQQHLCGLS